MRRRVFLARTAAAGIAAAFARPRASGAQAPSRAEQRPPTSANLLRNGAFQDDWLSLMPQNQTLHWAYANTIYNRRDFNPDGWNCKGSWQWVDAEKPRGQRRVLLGPPKAEMTQRLQWFAIHDYRRVTGFPNAGGFPELRPVYSQAPERLVRDLMLRVFVRGDEVPANAGGVELGLAPLGSAAMSDPLGTPSKPLVSSRVPFPAGTFDWQWLEVRLPALAWLTAAAKLPADPAAGRARGLLLPSVIAVALRFTGQSGHVMRDRSLEDRMPLHLGA